MLIVAAWLCGWALSSPDPVPARVGIVIFLGCAPLAFAFARACVRAGWAILASPGETGIATVGLLRPRIMVSPALAQRLDPRALHAALEHERAHARHRDPLRIWLGQFATDLQWPRAAATRRFGAWLAALEQARDDEARAAGIDGADLAAAVLDSLRHRVGRDARACAQVTGDGGELRERITRLVQPLPDSNHPPVRLSGTAVASIVILSLSVALALGIACGRPIIAGLLAITS